MQLRTFLRVGYLVGLEVVRQRFNGVEMASGLESSDSTLFLLVVTGAL